MSASLVVGRPRGLTVAQRFMAKISPEPNTGCWLWLGGLCNNGYGRAFDGVRIRLAHRLAWELLVGPPPPEFDHRCNVRCCVNPAHLDPVSHKINCVRRRARQLARAA